MLIKSANNLKQDKGVEKSRGFKNECSETAVCTLDDKNV